MFKRRCQMSLRYFNVFKMSERHVADFLRRSSFCLRLGFDLFFNERPILKFKFLSACTALSNFKLTLKNYKNNYLFGYLYSEIIKFYDRSEHP